MTSPAREARLAAAAIGFTQVISRGGNHIVTKNPTTGKFAFDSQIGSGWHYGAGLEADSAWVVDTGAWQYKIEAVNGFKLNARNVLNAGNIIQWSDLASGQTITFQPLGLNWVDNVNDSRQQIAQPQAITAQVSDDMLYFPGGYGAGRHFKYVASVSKLNKLIIIDSSSNLPTPTVSNPYLEIEFIITPSSGVSLVVDGTPWDKKTKVNTANAIACKTAGGATVWSFAAPMAYDVAGSGTPGIMQLRKQGANFYCTVRFPKAWIDAATFPIALDPTVDYQQGSGNAMCWDSGSYTLNYYLYIGCTSSQYLNAAARWVVTLPAGATITASYASLNEASASGTPGT